MDHFPEAVARDFRHNSGISDRRRLVVRDEQSWAALWAEITQNRVPKPPLPSVDFEREMVVVAAMGSRPSGGFGIHIDRFYAADEKRFVVVREVSPGGSCYVTMAITSPLDAVRVPRHDGEVVFVERSETVECG